MGRGCGPAGATHSAEVQEGPHETSATRLGTPIAAMSALHLWVEVYGIVGKTKQRLVQRDGLANVGQVSHYTIVGFGPDAVGMGSEIHVCDL